jgi:hypothetical protein
MSWWIEVSREARSNLGSIPHSRDDAQQVTAHLKNLASQANPGEQVTTIDGHGIRYSEVGRFGVTFELIPSESQPPGKMKVINIVAFPK